MSFQNSIPTIRCGSFCLSNQSSRRHLPTSHSVDGVVDKNRGYIFSSVGSMYSLSSTKASEVTVTLVSKDNSLRESTLDAGSHSSTSAMRRFHHINIEIVISKDRAARRWNTDSFILKSHLINDFTDKPMSNRVPTSRAIVEYISLQRFRPSKYF